MNVRELGRILAEKAEKKLKTDIRYLAESGFWLSAGQMLTAGMSFILAVAFARLLPKEAFGTYKYLLSLASLVWAASLSGMGVALTRSVANGNSNALRQGFKSSLAWSMPMVAVSAAMSAYYFFKGNVQLGQGLAVVGIFSPALNSTSLYGAYLIGIKDFKSTSIYNAVTSAGSTAVLLISALYTDNPVALLASYFISNTVLNAVFYVHVSSKASRGGPNDPELVPFAKQLSALNILGIIAGQIDKVLVFHYLGAAQLAVYSFAIAIPEQVKGILKNVARAAFPKFSNRPISELQASMPGKLMRYCIATVPITAAYILAAPYVFELLLPQYADSVAYSQIFSLVIFTSAASIPLTALQAHAAKRQLAIYTATTNVLQIASNAALIYLFGLPGALASAMANRLIGFVIPLVLFQRIGK